MAQLTGSGPGHGTNYVMVDDANASGGRLWTYTFISGVVPISGNINTTIGVNTISDISRKLAGSPGQWYAFNQVVDSFLLDNAGSNPLYYTTSGTLDSTGSETAFLDVSDNITYNLQIGSIQIESSGASNTEFQLIGVV